MLYKICVLKLKDFYWENINYEDVLCVCVCVFIYVCSELENATWTISKFFLPKYR